MYIGYIYICIYVCTRLQIHLRTYHLHLVPDWTTIKLWSLEWPHFLRRSQMLVGHINDSVVWRLQQAIMIWMKCHLNGLCPCFNVIKLTYLGLQLNLFKSSSTLVYQPLETRKSFTVLHHQSSTSISTGVFSWGNLWQFGRSCFGHPPCWATLLPPQFPVPSSPRMSSTAEKGWQSLWRGAP